MRKLILKIALVITPLIGITSLPAVVYADCNPTDTASAIQCGTDNAAGVPNSGNAESNLNSTVTTVVNILSVVVGIVAVIMIIIGGFRYITSAGDTAKVGAAKNTILYAVIGLVIVALAQIIVQFVLNKTNNTLNGTANTGSVSQGGANSPH